MSALTELARTGSIVTQTPSAQLPQLTTVLFVDGDVISTVAGVPSPNLLAQHRTAVAANVKGAFARLRMLRRVIRHTWWGAGVAGILALGDPASTTQLLAVAGASCSVGFAVQLGLAKFVRSRMGRLF